VVTVNGPGQVTTKAGATLMVPAGFVAKVEGSVVTLEEPDHLIELKLVEQDGEDLAAAIAGAWSLLDPGWSTAAEQTIEPPAKDGWEAIRVEGYPKGADGKNAQAVARRLGGSDLGFGVARAGASPREAGRSGPQLPRQPRRAWDGQDRPPEQDLGPPR
jgi:hypothetical protein